MNRSEGLADLGVKTQRVAPRLAPPTTTSQEEEMPTKLRRSSVALKAKAYRSAVTLAGVLVLLEALGAPRKL